MFSFGPAQNPQNPQNPQVPGTGFVFSQPQVQPVQPQPNTGFSFGTQAGTNVTSSGTSGGTLSFGPAPAQAGTGFGGAGAGFSFGAPGTSSGTGLTFGAPVATSAPLSLNPPAGTSSFSLGGAVNSTQNASPGFGFGMNTGTGRVLGTTQSSGGLFGTPQNTGVTSGGIFGSSAGLQSGFGLSAAPNTTAQTTGFSFGSSIGSGSVLQPNAGITFNPTSSAAAATSVAGGFGAGIGQQQPSMTFNPAGSTPTASAVGGFGTAAVPPQPTMAFNSTGSAPATSLGGGFATSQSLVSSTGLGLGMSPSMATGGFMLGSVAPQQSQQTPKVSFGLVAPSATTPATVIIPPTFASSTTAPALSFSSVAPNVTAPTTGLSSFASSSGTTMPFLIGQPILSAPTPTTAQKSLLQTAPSFTTSTAIPTTGLDFLAATAATAPAASTFPVAPTATTPAAMSSAPRFGLATTVAAPPLAAATTGSITTAPPVFSMTTATSTTASSSSNPTFSLGMPTAATSSAATTGLIAATTTTAAPVGAAAMNFRQLEEAINKWTLELEEQEKIFLTQATQVNAWDRLLIHNGEKITQLNDSLDRAKLDQQHLDHEIDFIVAQQKELEELLVPLENSLDQAPSISIQQHADLEREHTYHLADNIDAQLKRMSEDLKEIIDHLNASNNNYDNSDPIYQVGKILNAHMDSLQWIDQNTLLVQRKLEEVSRLHCVRRKDQERRIKLAYD